ncbi:hypothetical protein ACHAXA_006932 [Cyclostephanos tholiformis]|uniref:Uncharacterized protein n=1 Tax=Cyclostephanos tholiformis TaxID=382380 RepID=A0ABD3RRT5_9STRA
MAQPLLNPTSVALSLSPPRAPPHGTAMRSLYVNGRWAPTPSPPLRRRRDGDVYGDDDHDYDDDDDDDGGRALRDHSSQSRLIARLLSKAHPTPPSSSSSSSSSMRWSRPGRHPHLSTSPSLHDGVTRFLLGAIIPPEVQRSFRDTGRFRSIVDAGTAMSCPLVGLSRGWRGVRDFVELSRPPLDDIDIDRDLEYVVEAPSSSSSSSSSWEGGEAGVADAIGTGDEDSDRDDGVDRRRRSRRRRRRRRDDARGGMGHGGGKGWSRRRVPYGDRRHPMRYFDLYLPSPCVVERDVDDDGRVPVRGTVFFVHGGAWGSGMPWMYRLVAPAFLGLNFAVVIVGYRTYPDASTIDEQVGDVVSSWEICGDVLGKYCRATTTTTTMNVDVRNRNIKDDGAGNDDIDDWVGNVIMGHSSGAHVAMLALVDWIENRRRRIFDSASNLANDAVDVYPWTPDYFVGLSGPYDISHHFDYEAGRGVEEISPMKPICGHTRANFRLASPVYRFLSLLCSDDDEDAMTSVRRLSPPILLVHGIEDATVPFTATADAGRMLRSCGLARCDEMYLDGTGHQDVIMHFMFGGPAKDLVLNWIFQCRRAHQLEVGNNSSPIRSRL